MENKKPQMYVSWKVIITGSLSSVLVLFVFSQLVDYFAKTTESWSILHSGIFLFYFPFFILIFLGASLIHPPRGYLRIGVANLLLGSPFLVITVLTLPFVLVAISMKYLPIIVLFYIYIPIFVAISIPIYLNRKFKVV